MTHPPTMPAEVASQSPRTVSGRSLVIGILTFALALTGLAGFYYATAPQQAAEFWGPRDVRRLLSAPHVALYQLEAREQGVVATAPAVSDLAFSAPGEQQPASAIGRLARQEIVNRWDLSGAPGLTRFRYQFTQDDNFQWSGRRRAARDDVAWRYALQFNDREQEPPQPSGLLVLFNAEGDLLGKLPADSRPADSRPDTPPQISADAELDLLPCPGLATSIRALLDTLDGP